MHLRFITLFLMTAGFIFDAPLLFAVEPSAWGPPETVYIPEEALPNAPSVAPVVVQAPQTVVPPVSSDPIQAIANNKPILDNPIRDVVAVDLWGRIRNGFGMAEIDGALLRQHETSYASRPDYLKRMLERGNRYLFYIVEEVEKRGMPTEIALLPIIESAFNPTAYSRSHASGIWQFIPSTGKDYGLQQNWWYDGRRDILAATSAALDYLQKLHGQFGDWQLALAAYNSGEGTVGRAIARNRARGLATDFESLNLPAETRNYVPKLIAIKHIINDPAAFGVSLASIPNQPYFTTITTKQRMDTKVAAQLADMPLADFVSLNPGHNRPVITSSGERALIVPVDKAEAFHTNLANYDKPLVSWQSYPARKGEWLNKIAQKFNTTIAWLKENNPLHLRKNKLATSQTLLVPLRGETIQQNFDQVAAVTPQTVEPEVAPASPSKTSVVVRRGETLFSIARRHDVSAQQIKSWNGLRSNRVTQGQRLVLHTEKTTARKQIVATKTKHRQGKRTLYTVRRGDTVHSIARHFNVAADELQRWNSFSGKRSLNPGNKLTIFLASKS